MVFSIISIYFQSFNLYFLYLFSIFFLTQKPPAGFYLPINRLSTHRLTPQYLTHLRPLIYLAFHHSFNLSFSLSGGAFYRVSRWEKRKKLIECVADQLLERLLIVLQFWSWRGLECGGGFVGFSYLPIWLRLRKARKKGMKIGLRKFYP